MMKQADVHIHASVCKQLLSTLLIERFFKDWKISSANKSHPHMKCVRIALYPVWVVVMSQQSRGTL